MCDVLTRMALDLVRDPDDVTGIAPCCSAEPHALTWKRSGSQKAKLVCSHFHFAT